MMPELAGNWYDFDQIRNITNEPPRSLRRRLAETPANLMRLADPDGRGRPCKLWHFSADPRLVSHHLSSSSSNPVDLVKVSDPSSAVNNSSSLPSLPSESSGTSRAVALAKADVLSVVKSSPTSDDLAIAELRFKAVTEYLTRRDLLSAEAAAIATCRDWWTSPRIRTVRTETRLPGGHTRILDKQVWLNTFHPVTLRRWAAIYKEKGNLLALAPEKKGRVGRKQTEIPESLLNMVYSLSASTARADVAKAVEASQKLWPTEFPKAAICSWRRWLKAMDPRKAGKSLMQSVSKFRATQSPDIEMDYNLLPYNGLWQIDDVQEDWYALADDTAKALRPFAYAIIRVRTRQWVALVTSATKIIEAQVHSLVGWAMASPMGGIPDKIKFERGTTACDAYLEDLLESLGCRVGRTSMDGGAVVPGAIEDGAKGHFQGKGVIEGNFRSHHARQWNVPTQVGGEERHTAPGRLAGMLAVAAEAKKRGEPIPIPVGGQWHGVALAAMEAHNNRPHTGLPMCIDEHGVQRHMSPNEVAAQLKAEEIRIMPESYLPAFATSAEKVKITRNGFRLNNHWYGRFDTDLQKLESATVYACPDMPELVWCEDLGKSLEAYAKADPTSSDCDQFEQKKHTEHAARNQFEARMADAMTTGAKAFLQAVTCLTNPTPNRPRKMVEVPVLDARLRNMRTSTDRMRSRQADLDSRFDIGSGSRPRPAATRGRGLLARAGELEEDVAVLSGGSEI